MKSFLELEFIRQLQRELFGAYSFTMKQFDKFFVAGQKLIFCSVRANEGCKTT